MTFLFSKTSNYFRHLTKETKKAGKRSLKHFVIKAALIALFFGLIAAITFSGIGIFSPVQAKGEKSQDINNAHIAQSIIEDARNEATQKYGKSWEADDYFNQLLTAYSASQNKDIVILFNSGGWGTKGLQNSSHWTTIVNGIQDELKAAGFKVITLNYQRTEDSFQGKLNELKEMFTGYMDKADKLAACVDFILKYNPQIKVIIAGESMGTIICDSAMDLLKNDQDVYSIQTGSPFWQRNSIIDRTLQIDDNGVVPDAFHKGDLWMVVRCSFASLIGIEKDEHRGNILGFLAAPGHEYWWSDPGVGPKLETFLLQNLGIQSVVQPVK